MTVVFATLGFILSVSVWARPLIHNETTTLKALLGLDKTRSVPRQRTE